MRGGGKFASLTAGLLVRKGEAMPSPVLASGSIPLHRALNQPSAVEQVPANGHDSESSLELADDQAETPEQTPAKGTRGSAPDKVRRLMVVLTPGEYETLGLIAVKKGTTRHRLMRMAFDEYLALLVDEYGGSCKCIDSGCDCA